MEMQVTDTVCKIDAKGIYYRALNETVRNFLRDGQKELQLFNVEGQRYIGGGLKQADAHIIINGVPGEDLGAFMDGPKITVMNNAQDGVGNTMNSGKIVVRGMAGDVIGYGMRGGRIYVKGNAGYRVGIHMKGYFDKQPVLVIGGKAGHFFGEYMAGGYLVLLGIGVQSGIPVVGDYCATGMHGGIIYVRGVVKDECLGREVKRFPLDDNDKIFLKPLLEDFLSECKIDYNVLDFEKYSKIIPVSKRPYGKLYAY